MNVLLIGACGYLGPHVVKALAPRHRLRITDIRPPSPATKREFADHEFRNVDVAEPDQVADAAQGMDAIVNLSVVRNHPVQAFRVNVLGCQPAGPDPLVNCFFRNIQNSGYIPNA